MNKRGMSGTLIIAMPENTSYYLDFLELFKKAQEDGYVSVLADWDITQCELQMGDTYEVDGQTVQVMSTSYIMAEQRHLASMQLIDKDGHVRSLFTAYASDIADDENWVQVSRWGESKPKLKVL
jgi:hypothetical protein